MTAIETPSITLTGSTLNRHPRRTNHRNLGLALVLSEDQREPTPTRFTPPSDSDRVSTHRRPFPRATPRTPAISATAPIHMNRNDLAILARSPLYKHVINMCVPLPTQRAQHHAIVNVKHQMPPIQCHKPHGQWVTGDATK